MADGETRKKYIILGISTIILVMMIIGIIVGSRNVNTGNYNRQQEISESQKAVEALCTPTDYKDTCIYSLKSVDSADPKELMITAFKVTSDHLKQALANSSVLLALEKDPKTKLALDNCQELTQNAVVDLERTFNKFGGFDINNLDAMLDDIQVWLSGAITYQETCLDGFKDAPGDAGEKMRKVLNMSMELTSNGLAMINDISSIASTLDLPSHSSRRLLSDGADFPNWFDGRRRKLIQATSRTIKPDLIVAKDGSGKYRTLNEALKDIPKNSNKTFVLYIKEGVYEEKVTFEKSQIHLLVIGDGPTKTRITGKLNYIDGTPTYHTATVAVHGDFFIAKDIGFENSAGAEKHQAVALRVGADKAIFYNCHMDGYQDTLYAHTYRQFYRNCQISGTIDFIFGDSAAVFQNCTMVVRKPLKNQQCIVTAQGRKDVHQPTGLVLQNCSIVADPEYFPYRFELKSYLGRPWKQFSRTIIIESFIDDLIHPNGWLPWEGTFALDTLFYSEFNNRGPSSNKNLRVQWKGVKELQVARVERFLPPKFIEGNTWIPATGIPYNPGFIFPPPKEDPKIKYSEVAPEETKDLGSPKEKASYKAFPTPESTNATKSNSSNITAPQFPDTVPVLTSPTAAVPDLTTSAGPTPNPNIIDVLTPPPEATSPTGDAPNLNVVPELTPSPRATPKPDIVPVLTPSAGAAPNLNIVPELTFPPGATPKPNTVPVLTLSPVTTPKPDIVPVLTPSPVTTPKPDIVPVLTPSPGATSKLDIVPMLTPSPGATPKLDIVPMLTPSPGATPKLDIVPVLTPSLVTTPKPDRVPVLTPSPGTTPKPDTVPVFTPSSVAKPDTVTPLPVATPKPDSVPTLNPQAEDVPILTHSTRAVPVSTPPVGANPVLSPPTEAIPKLTPPTGAIPVLTHPARDIPKSTPPTGAVSTLTPPKEDPVSTPAETVPTLTLPARAVPVSTPPAGDIPALSSPTGVVHTATPPTGTVPVLTPPTRATPNPESKSNSISGNNSGSKSPNSVPVSSPAAGAQSPRTSLGLGPTSNNPPSKPNSSSVLSWFHRKLW